MAKRFTDTGIWCKEWFMALPPKLKCLFRYICDNCDPSGVWTPNWRLATLQIGQRVAEADLIKFSRQIEILEDGKIFVPDFINFQYGKLSEASPAHKPIFKAIEKNRLSDRVFNRVSNTLQEKETDKEKEKEKDFGKSENLLQTVVYTIEHCAEISMNDDRWVGANKATREELEAFNEFLEQLAIYEKNPADYKRHFANLKRSYPDRVRPKAKILSIEELRVIAREIDNENIKKLKHG